jgi:hypothetical protein
MIAINVMMEAIFICYFYNHFISFYKSGGDSRAVTDIILAFEVASAFPALGRCLDKSSLRLHPHMYFYFLLRLSPLGSGAVRTRQNLPNTITERTGTPIGLSK